MTAFLGVFPPPSPRNDIKGTVVREPAWWVGGVLLRNDARFLPFVFTLRRDGVLQIAISHKAETYATVNCLISVISQRMAKQGSLKCRCATS